MAAHKTTDATRRSTPTWAGTRPARAGRAGSSSNATAIPNPRNALSLAGNAGRSDIAPQADSQRGALPPVGAATSARSSRSASTRTRPPKPTTAVTSRTSAAGAEVMTRRSRGRRPDASNGPSSRMRSLVCSVVHGVELTGGPGARQGLRQHLGELARPAVRSGDSLAHAAARAGSPGWPRPGPPSSGPLVRALPWRPGRARPAGIESFCRPRSSRPPTSAGSRSSWPARHRGQRVGDLDRRTATGVGQRRLASVGRRRLTTRAGRMGITVGLARARVGARVSRAAGSAPCQELYSVPMTFPAAECRRRAGWFLPTGNESNTWRSQCHCHRW